MALFASRLNGIAPSPIAVLSQRARDLKAAGTDVIDLGVGEPDFDTPDFVKEATIAAMARGETKYTPTNGSPALRRAIAEKFRRDNSLTYSLDQIAVSAGAKQIIFNAMMATLDPGDEVVLPAPYWASYPDIVRSRGARRSSWRASSRTAFARPRGPRGSADAETKWLFLNSPSNPSGARMMPPVSPRSRACSWHTRRSGCCPTTSTSISCSTDGPSPRSRRSSRACSSAPVTMNGVSKTYAMTGWRLGYAGAPEPMIRAMTNVQSQCTTHASSLSQAGALARSPGRRISWPSALPPFRSGATSCSRCWPPCRGLACAQPEGAFYVFPVLRRAPRQKTPRRTLIETDQDLAVYLLEEAGVSVVPGSSFRHGASPAPLDRDRDRRRCAPPASASSRPAGGSAEPCRI
jgi:aspartate aminotransferase